jgi:zinc protease
MPLTFPAVSRLSGAVGNIASATRHVFPNGIVALIYQNASSPTVSIRGTIGAGAVHEPADKSGLAVLTAKSLVRGTRQRSFQQIAVETEERGCSVHAGGGPHHSGFSGRALIEDLPLVLDILADMLMHPTFPANEIEKLRGQFLMWLRESEEETQTQASRALRAMLYPPAHPYSRLSSGSLDTIASISREDLVAFHQNYHPAATAIAVVGDVEPDAIIELLEQYFGGWESSVPVPTLQLPDVPPLAGIQRRDISMDGKVQSDVIWGVHGLKRKDPDYYAAMLGNMILGRIGMGGRLGDNVREEQGMAYYISSSLSADETAGPWAAIAGVNPTDVERTIAAIFHEIERFKQDGPTDQELSDVRAYLTGSLALGLESHGGIANTLLSIERFGLGLDYIVRYPDIINNVTHDDIVRVARAYLSTENCTLAVAGPPVAPSAAAS